LSLGASLFAAVTNGVFGLLVAWILVRYRFPFRRIVDGLVDLPFALPTAVAGIVLTTMYSQNGWVGSRLDRIGIKVAYTRLGVVVALSSEWVMTTPPIRRVLTPQLVCQT
jgi:sulfate transport system permease protein